MINFKLGLDHLRYLAQQRKSRATQQAPAADLTSVPSGIKIGGGVKAVRLNRTALNVALAGTLGVFAVAILTAPEPQERKGHNPATQPEAAGTPQKGWWESEPDFFVAPVMPAPVTAPAAPAKGGSIHLPAPTGDASGLPMPPPPSASSFAGAPPLLPSNGGAGSNMAGGTGNLDPKTARAPMVAWRAPAAGAVSVPAASTPASVAQLAPGRQLPTAQPAVMTPSTVRTASLGQGVAPTSQYEIQSGWTIPGVLITGANSDTPGMLLGQVAENVFDSRTGKHLLIPAGSRLIGTYATGAAWGQDRLQVSWVRMILPDGTEYDMSGLSAADGAGSAGMQDQVNQHYGRLIGSAILMSWFGVQSELAAQRADARDSSMSAAMGASTARQLDSTAQTILQRDARVSPTIEIRPGYRFNIISSRSIVFNKAYKLPAHK